jgi:hypothetical protein
LSPGNTTSEVAPPSAKNIPEQHIVESFWDVSAASTNASSPARPDSPSNEEVDLAEAPEKSGTFSVVDSRKSKKKKHSASSTQTRSQQPPLQLQQQQQQSSGQSQQPQPQTQPQDTLTIPASSHGWASASSVPQPMSLREIQEQELSQRQQTPVPVVVQDTKKPKDIQLDWIGTAPSGCYISLQSDFKSSNASPVASRNSRRRTATKAGCTHRRHQKSGDRKVTSCQASFSWCRVGWSRRFRKTAAIS